MLTVLTTEKDPDIMHNISRIIIPSFLHCGIDFKTDFLIAFERTTVYVFESTENAVTLFNRNTIFSFQISVVIISWNDCASNTNDLLKGSCSLAVVCLFI